MPQTLDYDPWVLAGKIHHRLAGTIRSLIGMWVKVDEHETLPELKKRVEALEKARVN
jgi:hypothetical protein